MKLGRGGEIEMSGNYTDTSGRSDTYNAGAAHDSGFYDAAKHDNQIVAVYEDHDAAQRAQQSLVQSGIPEAQVKIVAKVAGDAAKGVSEVEDKTVGDEILGAFMSLFTSKDDHHDFTHAVDRGHAMVVVTPTGDTDRHQVVQLLEQTHPIDFDAKLAEWRQAGYDASGAARATEHEESGHEDPGHEGGRRVGEREVMPGPSRVRSYVANRDPQTAAMGTGGDVTNATAGATSSGMNAPRRAG